MSIDVPIIFGEHASLSEFLPLPDGEDQYPVEFIEHHRAIKLRESDQEVSIALATDPDESLMNRLWKFHRKTITYYMIDYAELAAPRMLRNV